MAKYIVKVIETRTGRIERRLGTVSSMRAAERLERGVTINLDHERFHTEIATYGAEAASNENSQRGSERE